MFKEAHENEKCGVVPKLQANKKENSWSTFLYRDFISLHQDMENKPNSLQQTKE
jgi:hypothetical protein